MASNQPRQDVFLDYNRGGIDALVAAHGRVQTLYKHYGLECKGQGVGQFNGLIQLLEGIDSN